MPKYKVYVSEDVLYRVEIEAANIAEAGYNAIEEVIKAKAPVEAVRAREVADIELLDGAEVPKTQEIKWSEWNSNPLAACAEVAEQNGLSDELRAAIQETMTWERIEADEFLTELLQHIAGSTHILVQEHSERMLWRAGLELAVQPVTPA